MSDDTPETSAPVLRREALLPGERNRGLGTVAVVCTMAGVASGLALATTLMAMQVADTMSVRTCPYRSAKLHTTVDPAHGFLGITYVFDQKKNVALVTGVASWGPAAEAGVKPNDLVIAVNGDRVDSDLEIQQKISSMRPGTRPTITIEREGAKRDVRPTLMPWPVFTY